MEVDAPPLRGSGDEEKCRKGGGLWGGRNNQIEVKLQIRWSRNGALSQEFTPSEGAHTLGLNIETLAVTYSRPRPIQIYSTTKLGLAVCVCVSFSAHTGADWSIFMNGAQAVRVIKYAGAL